MIWLYRICHLYYLYAQRNFFLYLNPKTITHSTSEKNMKCSTFVTVVLTGLIGLIICATVQARSLNDIQADGTIIIATEGLNPPFNFYQDSQLTAFEIEIGEAVAKKMGLKVDWKTLAFDSLLSGLRQNRWDLVIASFGVTPRRAKAVKFTQPHYCSGAIIVSKDKAALTMDGLKGKTVAVTSGTTNLQHVKKIPAIKNVKIFPMETDARAALLNDRVDVWVVDRFAAKSALDSGSSAGLMPGELLFTEKVASAVKKDNASLADAYNLALAKIMSDGTYKTISDKYMKEDIRCK